MAAQPILSLRLPLVGMFANPNHPTVEYHYRPDGTRPYSHCEDRDLFRVINVEGDCVYYLRKLTPTCSVWLSLLWA